MRHNMREVSNRDPSRIVDALLAFWQADALAAGIDLGLFTALADRARTARQLSAECGADEPRLRRLCDHLVSLSFLRKRGDRYQSSRDAARFLDARSPDSIVAAANFFRSAEMARAFSRLAETVRRPRAAATRKAHGASAVVRWDQFARDTLPLRRWHVRPMAAAVSAISS